jgi:hypothetical protein
MKTNAEAQRTQRGAELLLRRAQTACGARASARFNVQFHEVHKTCSPLAAWTLKRRERRAPCAPTDCRLISNLCLCASLHSLRLCVSFSSK